MATNRTKRARKIVPALTNEQIEWLYTDVKKQCDAQMLLETDEERRRLWESNKDEVLAWWIQHKPGTRPRFWWKFEAPEMRQRLGGRGTLKHEVLSYVPDYHCGIPSSWITEFEENYYSGRAKDIHGNIISSKHQDGDFEGVSIDLDDPPTFESQATYLHRHSFLTAEENEALLEHPELLEPERVIP